MNAHTHHHTQRSGEKLTHARKAYVASCGLCNARDNPLAASMTVRRLNPESARCKVWAESECPERPHVRRV